MSLREELPYRAEYAKSGRASCKSCKDLISNSSLRMAVMVQSPFFDGKQANWHHFQCFFKRFRPKSGSEIAHFAELKFEDQKKIETSIASTLGLTPIETTKKGKKKKITDKDMKELKDKAKYGDFKVEYSKSNRAKCRLCENTINKNDIRISRLDRESEDALRYGPLDRWFHTECFVSARNSLNFYASAEMIPCFKDLETSDQNMLKKKLPQIEEPIDTNANNGDNKTDESESPQKKKKPNNKSEDKELKKQSDLLFKLRDNLNAIKKSDLIELLNCNEITVPEGISKILERLSDAMAFGVLEKCGECSGQLVFRISGYICTGMATEWAQCSYQTDKPIRKPFKVSKELTQKYDFLKKYKYVKRDRIYVPALQEAIQSSVASTSTANTVLPKKEENGGQVLPLSGYKIFSIGKLKTTRPKLKIKIEKLGGILVSNIDRTTLCVITTKAEVDKESSKLKDAEELHIHVVSEDFLLAVENGTNPIQAMSLNMLTQWGGDIEQRFTNLNIKEKMKSAFKSGKSSGSGKFDKSGPSVQKMVLKGGNVVDPECELHDKTHILKDGKDVYNAILNKVDLTANKNSYYKLQLLEHDSKKTKYWVFRAWGRVGTSIGGNTLSDFKSKEAAIDFFKDEYLDKTKNNWENRNNFKKQPKSFFPVDIDYGSDKQIQKLEPGNSRLHKAVQDLICMIFDVQKMKEAMLEFELDLEKMPLGKLSKKQLLNACSVLKEISQLIETKPPNNTKLTDASNRFYTLVPHNFGTSRPPLIESEEMIKLKMEMLEALLDIEMAYEMLTSKDKNEKLDPIDQHYEKLNTKIEPLEKSEKEFSIIEKYVQNTHASTHFYNLEIQDVFKVERNGEYERFKKFKDMDNRMLLWHGSRVTNFPGILSQGLRIAPPEAPVTGYMFGKGIYFADMVSKSANYCCHSSNNNIGLLLLSEVAIGETYELTNAKDVKKLPKNKHSVKGVGKTEPDPKETFVLSNGVKVPLGKGIELNDKSKSLLYNEYIVYDVNQVNIKYLLRVKFSNKF